MTVWGVTIWSCYTSHQSCCCCPLWSTFAPLTSDLVLSQADTPVWSHTKHKSEGTDHPSCDYSVMTPWMALQCCNISLRSTPSHFFLMNSCQLLLPLLAVLNGTYIHFTWMLAESLLSKMEITSLRACLESKNIVDYNSSGLICIRDSIRERCTLYAYTVTWQTREIDKI